MVTLAEAKSESSMLAPLKPAMRLLSCSSSSMELRSSCTCLEASRTPGLTCAYTQVNVVTSLVERNRKEHASQLETYRTPGLACAHTAG